MERADKGGATVVISESRMNEESRRHVENDKAYEKASNFGNVLGKKPEGLRKLWEVSLFYTVRYCIK